MGCGGRKGGLKFAQRNSGRPWRIACSSARWPSQGRAAVSERRKVTITVLKTDVRRGAGRGAARRGAGRGSCFCVVWFSFAEDERRGRNLEDTGRYILLRGPA